MTDSPRRPAARIAVDLLGGDAAPAVVVDGALRACGADPDLVLLLVGPPEVADAVIAGLPTSRHDSVDVDPVFEAVGMADPASDAIHRETTVRAAMTALADGRVDAVVTAGATGAAVTAAVTGLGRSPGVRRPALAASVPAVTGPIVLLDVGAGTDVPAPVLAQHAALGAAYAHTVHGLAAPRVGLLSIGSEPGKGDRLRRDATTTLASAPLPGSAEFVGYVEGHEVTLGGRADVVVTDGFTGNVLLKGIEGAYALAAGHQRANGPRVAVPRAAALLGVRGVVVVCHGAAGGTDVADGIALAAHLHRVHAADRITGAVDPTFEVPATAEVGP